ncbi:hypothetical protein CDAR_424611 [Caerostris darwini]|uniref:Uncharacterized protein n=1 Tax=Caerostris darwini TaxID=1538125 RepID=A0AAV4VCM1_9ARAC|nr:hypothetical protein CDAR_424611 [Caerostris darwini]
MLYRCSAELARCYIVLQWGLNDRNADTDRKNSFNKNNLHQQRIGSRNITKFGKRLIDIITFMQGGKSKFAKSGRCLRAMVFLLSKNYLSGTDYTEAHYIRVRFTHRP